MHSHTRALSVQGDNTKALTAMVSADGPGHLRRLARVPHRTRRRGQHFAPEVALAMAHMRFVDVMQECSGTCLAKMVFLNSTPAGGRPAGTGAPPVGREMTNAKPPPPHLSLDSTTPAVPQTSTTVGCLPAMPHASKTGALPGARHGLK